MPLPSSPPPPRVRLRGGGCGGSKASDGDDASVVIDAVAPSFIQDLDSDEPSPHRHQKLFSALLAPDSDHGRVSLDPRRPRSCRGAKQRTTAVC